MPYSPYTVGSYLAHPKGEEAAHVVFCGVFAVQLARMPIVDSVQPRSSVGAEVITVCTLVAYAATAKLFQFRVPYILPHYPSRYRVDGPWTMSDWRSPPTGAVDARAFCGLPRRLAQNQVALRLLPEVPSTLP